MLNTCVERTKRSLMTGTWLCDAEPSWVVSFARQHAPVSDWVTASIQENRDI